MNGDDRPSRQKAAMAGGQADGVEPLPDRPPALPRVAVLVVHGVGNPPRDHSARTVADLLLRFHSERYSAFRTSRLQLAVAPAPTPKDVAPVADSLSKAQKAKAHVNDAVDARTESVRALHRAESGTASPDEIGFAVMGDRLKHLKLEADDQIYDTIRCESTLSAEGRPCGEVHIHEMHWADLSSLGTDAMRAFGQLYDLFFDLCLVGRQTLDAVSAMHPKSRPWQFFRWAHRISELLLVQPIFLFNLLMGLFALVMAVPLAPEIGIKVAVAGAPAVLTGAGVALLCFWGHRKIPAGFWPWLLAGIALVTGLVAWKTGPAAWHLPADQLVVCASGLAALAVVGAFIAFAWGYEKRKTGALAGAGILAILALFWYSREIAHPVEAQTGGMLVIDAVLRTIEELLLGLSWVWQIQWVLLVGLLTFPWLAPRVTRVGAAEKKRLRRATFTAQLSLMLPVSATIIVTHCFWGALVLTLQAPLVQKFPNGVHHFRHPIPGVNVAEALDCALREMVIHGVPILPRAIAIAALATLVAAWSLAPAIWHEKTAKNISRKKDNATWLGRNLTMGFRGMRVGGELLRWCIVVSTVLTLAWMWRYDGQLPTQIERPWIYTSLAIGGTGVLAILGARGNFRFLVLGFYSVLQVAIDTINWMRAHPREHNPQACISARYASVLRHLFAWRSPVDQRPYDAVIVFAHSQGSVITVDVLRYLQHVEPRMDKVNDAVFGPRPPVHLFTMGCPLRQHYGQRFPHTYGWARFEDQPEPTPNPAALWAVQTWRNAYRSGDYVGRCLWHDEKKPETWERAPTEPAPGHPTEFCVGPGAHTHYWDETAEPVADELQGMIEQLCGEKASGLGR